MDEEELNEIEEAYHDFEAQIRKLLNACSPAVYNNVKSWALVVQATSNDGDGDRTFGGLFMPPDQDSFTTAGLRWLFDEGFRQRQEY